jgi:hypothetical protein
MIRIHHVIIAVAVFHPQPAIRREFFRILDGFVLVKSPI